MKGNEKNLLFLGIIMLLVLVVFGLRIVDNSLTGLLLPDSPYLTVAVEYEHGIIIRGPERVIHIPVQDIASLLVNDGSIEIRTCGIKIRIPFTYDILAVNPGAEN